MMKIFDIQQSVVAANGNVSLARELFTMLLDDLDVRFEQINSCYKNNDIDTLAEHTHKLYGATAYCIVPKLRQSTEKLDTSLSDKNLSHLSAQVATVLLAITELIKEGPEFLKKDWSDKI